MVSPQGIKSHHLHTPMNRSIKTIEQLEWRGDEREKKKRTGNAKMLLLGGGFNYL
jgi:hypothetical protein